MSKQKNNLLFFIKKKKKSIIIHKIFRIYLSRQKKNRKDVFLNQKKIKHHTLFFINYTLHKKKNIKININKIYSIIVINFLFLY